MIARTGDCSGLILEMKLETPKEIIKLIDETLSKIV